MDDFDEMIIAFGGVLSMKILERITRRVASSASIAVTDTVNIAISVMLIALVIAPLIFAH